MVNHPRALDVIIDISETDEVLDYVRRVEGRYNDVWNNELVSRFFTLTSISSSHLGEIRSLTLINTSPPPESTSMLAGPLNFDLQDKTTFCDDECILP